MATTAGSSITAAFYNAVQSTVAAVLGTVASGTGYGQTLASSQVAVGATITAGQWAALQADINKCRQHQSGSVFSTTDLPNITAGMTITAAMVNYYETQAGVIQTNRALASAANMSLTSSALTITRASTWGSAAGAITCEAKADFGSQAAARQFFNTGGELRFALAHPSTTASQDTAWGTLLSGIGTVTLKGDSLTRSGALGTVTNTGFNSMATSYGTIVNATSATANYTTNTAVISAMQLAGGTGVQFRIQLTDSHTNANYDVVQSGTNVVFAFLKSTVIMTGITNPTWTTVTAF